jgi:hypothetical protein
MSVKRRHIIFIFIALSAISTCLYAHFNPIAHDAPTAFLEATDTQITCGIENNKTFKKKNYYYSDGSFYGTTGWNPELPHPAKITIAGTAHGLGFAQILFHGSVDRQRYGNRIDLSPAIEIGWTLLFYGHDVHNEDVSKSESVSYTISNGGHDWDGQGTIQYTPYYFKIRVGFPWGISGTWENGATWSSSDTAGGKWKIDQTATSSAINPNPHNSNGSGSDH